MKALGIILAGGKNERLKELTHNRALAAMPVAGAYRAIDFALSNMSNSGVLKVAAITQYNSRSLIEHMSSSKWWDFGRKHGGLSVFTPFITHDNSRWYRGTADAIMQNIHFLKNSHEPYVIITQGDSICKMDYDKVIRFHIEKRADITVVCKEVFDDDLTRFGHVKANDHCRIIEFEEKPIEPEGNLVNTGIYVIRRRLLIELIEQIAKEERFDFVTDILIRYRKQKRMVCYRYDGYWRSVSSLEGYYKANMDFLDPKLRRSFFMDSPPIMSKVQDEPPAKFNDSAQVKGALCSSGCIINGTLENAVLSRKVFIGNNTYIKNAIILNGTYIGNNCHIENAIVDSKTTLEDGVRIVGESTEKLAIVERQDPVFF